MLWRKNSERLSDELDFSKDMTFEKGLEVRIEVPCYRKGELTFNAKEITWKKAAQRQQIECSLLKN